MSYWVPEPTDSDLDKFYELCNEHGIEVTREEANKYGRNLLAIAYLMPIAEELRKREEANPKPPLTELPPTRKRKKRKLETKKRRPRRKKAPSAQKLHGTPHF